MRWIILFSIGTLLSCSKINSEAVVNESQPLVIAYYAGDAVSIDSFELEGVNQIIYSFMHLKGNRLAIDNEADSLALVALINQKIKYLYIVSTLTIVSFYLTKMFIILNG